MKITKELSDQLVGNTKRPAKDDVHGWVELYTSLYENIEEKRHYEKLRKNRDGGNTGGNTQNKPRNQQSQQGHNHQHNAQTPSNLPSAGDPMDLSRMDLHPDQCAYCKLIGHHKNACPTRPPGDWNSWAPTQSNNNGRGGRGFGGNAPAYNSQTSYSRGGGAPHPRGGGSGYPPANNYNYGQQQPQYQQQPNSGGGQPQVRFSNQIGAPPSWAQQYTQQLRQIDVPNPGFVVDDNQSSAGSMPTESSPGTSLLLSPRLQALPTRREMPRPWITSRPTVAPGNTY